MSRARLPAPSPRLELRRHTLIRLARRIAVAVGVAVLALASSPAAAAAQLGNDSTLFARLGLDRLRLASFGGSVGAVFPARMEQSEAVAIMADYGEIAPRWRVVFGATYWSSRLTDDVVRTYEDSLRSVLVDPTGDAEFSIGTVRMAVLSLTADVRRTAILLDRVRPYAGVGIGAYAVNAEGRGISGTFVENALDNIATGFAGVAGVDFIVIPNIALTMHARYDLLSGLRFATVRTGASYIFGARGRR